MNIFNNLTGQIILDIHRLDTQSDYEFYSPYAIILKIEEQSKKLILTAMNDGSSIDIRMTTDEEIHADYGLEFNEHILNELKPEDELRSLISEPIETVRIAEYTLPEITGQDYVIKHGKYAAVELKTKNHNLLFHNSKGGWCSIDDEGFELPNKDRWQWK
ncbi:MAG: hypothetical protein LCH54_16025 [Bacteroidetes bacterium]|nr:hypothetical protein [Bacteroidota bacterium]